DTTRAQLRHPLLRPRQQLVHGPEADRVRWARLRARGLEPVLQPVVAQRALVRLARALPVDLDHAERTRGLAVAAAVAHVLLDEDGVELGADDRAGRARLQARRVHAVLADVRHEQPPLPGLRPLLARGQVAPGLEFGGRLAPRLEARLVELLDEHHVSPRRGREVTRVVVRDAGEVEAVRRQVVALLARDLDRVGGAAERGVGEEAGRAAGRDRVAAARAGPSALRTHAGRAHRAPPPALRAAEARGFGRAPASIPSPRAP